MGRTCPARRIAIDFVAVDERGLPAPRTWRAALSMEPPGIFRGFGRPVLARLPDTWVIARDGEVDHVARRSQLTLLAYAVGQAGRVRGSPPTVAGNHGPVVGAGAAHALPARVRRRGPDAR